MDEENTHDLVCKHISDRKIRDDRLIELHEVVEKEMEQAKWELIQRKWVETHGKTMSIKKLKENWDAIKHGVAPPNLVDDEPSEWESSKDEDEEDFEDKDEHESEVEQDDDDDMEVTREARVYVRDEDEE